ncbi:hypothetical protein ARMGADRAFT_1021799 [Armillaria gallica]|uniref:Uncharacterized protein n=1 Tax=Armillaria gallica TaxID=47427 RepID=A0A2H3EI29_ARMGA|nr:hypothetical protein ARMGADRAFT_1021799 [Armillaria gallica]
MPVIQVLVEHGDVMVSIDKTKLMEFAKDIPVEQNIILGHWEALAKAWRMFPMVDAKAVVYLEMIQTTHNRKNHDQISDRQKKKYQKQKRQNKHCELAHSQSTRKAKDMVVTSMTSKAAKDTDTTVFSTLLDEANALQDAHSQILTEVLQIEGCGKVYHALQSLDGSIGLLVKSLEDIYCYAMEGSAKLLKAYNRSYAINYYVFYVAFLHLLAWVPPSDYTVTGLLGFLQCHRPLTTIRTVLSMSDIGPPSCTMSLEQIQQCIADMVTHHLLKQFAVSIHYPHQPAPRMIDGESGERFLGPGYH